MFVSINVEHSSTVYQIIHTFGIIFVPTTNYSEEQKDGRSNCFVSHCLLRRLQRSDAFEKKQSLVLLHYRFKCVGNSTAHVVSQETHHTFVRNLSTDCSPFNGRRCTVSTLHIGQNYMASLNSIW